jgi:hypothetical protein
MEEFMTSMGWDPTAVVNAGDWPALESMPDHGESSDPLSGCLAQTFRDHQVEFYVPDTNFLGGVATGNRQPERGHE